MSDGQNEVIVNDTDELARQFHDSYEEVAPLYGYTTRNDTRVFDPESPNGRLMRAVCLQVVGPIIAERNRLQDQRDFCMGEIERLRKERDEARENLAQTQKAWTDVCIERTKFAIERDEAREARAIATDQLVQAQAALREIHTIVQLRFAEWAPANDMNDGREEAEK